MKLLQVTVLAGLLSSCSLSPRIQPVTQAEMVGAYAATFHAGQIDSLYLNADSTYVRRFKSFDGVTHEDHGRWYLHVLGSRQNSPYVKLQLDQFITRFKEDSMSGSSPFDPIPGGIADSIAAPREARIWKEVVGSHVTLRIGDHYGSAWARDYDS